MGHSIISHDARSLDVPALSGFGRALRASLSATLRRMQVVRMATLLNSLNDTQLSQMGIRREEISNYAQTLVQGDITD